jgi:hypothetical protein
MTKTVYYDQRGPRRQHGFRGFASARWIDAPRSRAASVGAELPIPEQLYWALFELGLADQLARLPAEGELDPYDESTLYPEALSKACHLLSERAQTLAQQRYDWLCSRQLRPEHVEYRISVNAPQLASELRSLSSFLGNASKSGYAVQLAL